MHGFVFKFWLRADVSIDLIFLISSFFCDYGIFLYHKGIVNEGLGNKAMRKRYQIIFAQHRNVDNIDKQ